MTFIYQFLYRFSFWLQLHLDFYAHQKVLSIVSSSLGRCGANFYVERDILFIGLEYIEVGSDFHAGHLFRIEAHQSYKGISFQPQITIGDGVSFEDSCHVACIDRVQIGSGSMFASRVFISDHQHGFLDSRDIDVPPAFRKLVSNPVVIGCNVWVGEGVSILPGVELGDNVVVGANAVVTHSFPANSVIAGCPARLIRTL